MSRRGAGPSPDGPPGAILLTRRRVLGAVGVAALGGYALDQLLSGTEIGPPAVRPVVSVRAMGAKGDGRTNDTRAFQLASAAVMAARGGTLSIERGTYLIGHQQLAGVLGRGFAYRGEPVISISGCTRPVLIDGGGATLRTAPGLKLGAFDPVTGLARANVSLPFLDADFRSDIYDGAINLTGNVSSWIRDLDIDGNIGQIEFGGQYGDAGYQVGHDGVVAAGNGQLRVQDVHLHHHGRDGIMLQDPNRLVDQPGRPVTLVDVHCDYNGRQGLSWVGGRGLRATRCSFSFSGRVSIPVSNPGAGVDIEPEDSICRDALFSDCNFDGNTSFGAIANVGDAAEIAFKRCRFSTWSGSAADTTPRALWANKPLMSLDDCQFHGSIVQAYGSEDAVQACQFRTCTFDDLAQGSQGAPYIGVAIIETGGANVRLTGCRVQATRNRSVALGTPGQSAPVIIDGCTIDHRDSSLPPQSYQANLRSVSVSNTRFQESGLTHPYYIAVTDVTVGPDVEVQGPHVAWQRVGGSLGRIA